jgi:hypothetical protein
MTVVVAVVTLVRATSAPGTGRCAGRETEADEQRGQLVRGRPLAGIGREAGHDRLPHRRREARDRGRRGGRPLFRVRAVVRRLVEGAVPGQRLVQQDAHRVHVRRRRPRLPRGYLRGLVLRGSGNEGQQPGRGRPVDQRRHAEIVEQRLVRRGPQRFEPDLRRGQRPVHDADRVRRAERPTHPGHHAHRAVERQRTAPGQPVTQATARHEPADQRDLVVVHDEVVHGQDPGMLQPRDRLQRGPQLAQGGRVGEQLGTQQFDRHVGSGPAVPAVPDAAPGADAEFAEHFVALTELPPVYLRHLPPHLVTRCRCSGPFYEHGSEHLGVSRRGFRTRF